MGKNIVGEAAAAYKQGEYALALNLYGQAAERYGAKNFQANLKLCQAKLAIAAVARGLEAKAIKSKSQLNAQSNSTTEQDCVNIVKPELVAPQVNTTSDSNLKATKKQLERATAVTPDRITLGEGAGDWVQLNDTPIWTSFPVKDVEWLEIHAPIQYENIPEGQQRRALLLVEYLDELGNVLSGPYKGLSRSEAVGWFVYAAPHAADKELVRLAPCAGAVNARIGLRSYYAKPTERVSIGSTLQLKHPKRSPAIPPNGTRSVAEERTLPKQISIGNSETAWVTLGKDPTWTTLGVAEGDWIKIMAAVEYEGISVTERRRALVVVEYLDEHGKVLSGPYKGLTRSETVGWFVYAAPHPADQELLRLEPCKGAVTARIGFRTYYAKPKEQVRICSTLQLLWHDNNCAESKVKNSTASLVKPTLPCLPFELPKPQARRLKVASILDTFSHACFAPECDLISISPDKWREELFEQRIDFILVESSWHGNDDKWLYRVASYQKPPGDELGELIRWARRYGVPTVFWNKEDPPNFDRFIDRAADFDYIFTTDENCIERYRKRVPATAYLAALPFAAQPQIHNALLTDARLNLTSFAGTYYADDFEKRRHAMDILLRTAARHGLDIFDRMYNVKGPDKLRFDFPTDLQAHIRGSLAYNDMLKAYRRYRIALNVNSVSDSPTMFSRRVFELLACGTPVVSTESVGIDRMFAGLVPTVDSAEEAAACMQTLMTNTAEWIRTSLRGQRAVFSQHTYAHRVHEIALAIGLTDHVTDIAPVVVVVKPEGDASRFAEVIKNQHDRPVEVIVLGDGYATPQVKRHLEALAAAKIKAVAVPAQNAASFVHRRHPTAVAALCSSLHHYGPNYLSDARHALAGPRDLELTGMLPPAKPANFFADVTFEQAAQYGMPSNLVHSDTVAVRASSPALATAIRQIGCGITEGKGLTYRTRIPVEFIASLASSGVTDPYVLDIR